MDYTLQTHSLLLIFTECNAAAPWTTGDLPCFVNVDLVYFPKIVYFVFFNYYCSLYLYAFSFLILY